jgi:hypothetical protein
MSGYLKASIWILAAFSLALVLIYVLLPDGEGVRGVSEGVDKVEMGSSEEEVLLIMDEPDAAGIP